MNKLKSIIIIITIFFFNVNESQNILAEVKAPNYDFKLEEVSFFLPGNTKENIVQKFGKGEFITKKGQYLTERYYLKHFRYVFPVFVQIKGNTVVDTYIRLPSYFLHNVFHQALIKKYGKQDHYKRIEEQSVYLWNNKDNLRLVYGGACTITCFPIYLSITDVNMQQAGSFVPLIKRLGSVVGYEAL